ncbi:hypothetical protein HD597_005442 [Nonomuraea thailandensis]|uniref:Uncharacterized protein n=1 Tax=Nonomuraea thailandensis TaxID=1188745 RepID=A0A9X2GIN4_9ACTN|nr:hypothetical protein [Nonomuraea thailandensis]MCP2358422.1 hypothetical protein [Nonomuraea thailandensis]
MPPQAAAAATDRALTMRWPPPLHTTRKVAGLRLAATALPLLSGDGAAVLTGRL